jgi:Kinesin motor domain
MGTAAKNPAEIDEMDGVIPRAIQDLFQNIETKCDNNAQVEFSFLEVYNEEIRDLMNPNSTQKSDLRIRETLDGEVYVRGLQTRVVNNPVEIGKFMEEASQRRVVASTKMNAVSSRSHAICVLRIRGVLDDDVKFQAKLTLVDLAGSERIKKTQASGDRAQEGININKGLFTLGQCVSALAEQRPRFKRKPPFRDSKLTRLLQDSLGGNSRTIMIACCSPADFNLEETINTLRYATQARNIRNTATANVVQIISQDEALKLKRENDLLKQQVQQLTETIRILTQNVTEDDENRSVAMIHAEQERSFRAGRTISTAEEHMVSPLMDPRMVVNHCIKNSIPPMPRYDDGVAEPQEDEHINSDDDAAVIGGMGAVEGRTADPDLKSDDETSLNFDEVMPVLKSTDHSLVSHASQKSHQELEEENSFLRKRLRRASRDVQASVKQSAIELPALRARVELLEDELNDSRLLETETDELRRELEEAKADKNSAQLAAKQLLDFMEQQKKEFGFRGDELEKKRLWYFHKRLDEKWVQFVVIMLKSFKEQMRLLGDYFDLVVTVVESPDILSMLSPQARKRLQGGWFAGFNRQQHEHAASEEANLRNTLLTEHIKFFNSRLLEIEDEINNRSERVDTILENVGIEREQLESELDETEFVRDVFSKKGEKLLKDLTELMTGPLFSSPNRR